MAGFTSSDKAIQNAVNFLTTDWSKNNNDPNFYETTTYNLHENHKQAYQKAWEIQKKIIWLIGQGINPSADISKMNLGITIPPEVAYVYAHMTKGMNFLVSPKQWRENSTNWPDFGTNYGNGGTISPQSSATAILKQALTHTGYDFATVARQALAAAAGQWVQSTLSTGGTPQELSSNPRYAQAVADHNSGGAASSRAPVGGFSLTGQSWDGVDNTTSYKFSLGIPYRNVIPTLHYKGKTIDVNHYEGNINELTDAILAQYQNDPGHSVFAYIQSHLGAGSFTPRGTKSYIPWANILRGELHSLFRAYQTMVPPNSFLEITKNGHIMYVGETLLGGGPNGVRTGAFATNSMLANIVATASGQTPPRAPTQQNAVPPTPGYDVARGEQFAIKQATVAQAWGAYQAFDNNALSNWAISGFAPGSTQAKLWQEFMGYMQTNATNGIVYGQEEMINQFQTFKSKDPALAKFNLYDMMFPGLRDANKPAAQGGHDMHITEAQYLQGWDRIEQIAATYLPAGKFTRANYATMVKNGIGVTEMGDRIAKGYAAVISDPRTLAKFKQFNIGVADLTAYFLDPKNSTADLERKATAAQAASFAGQVGLTGLADNARQASNVADLIRGGQLGGQNAPGTPYSMDQFRQAALLTAKNLPLTKESSTNTSTPQSKVDEQTLLSATMPGIQNTGLTTVQAQQEVQKAEQIKSAPFQKGGGYSESQKGVVGAGSAAQ